MENKKEVLRKCPFCGGDAEVSELTRIFSGETHVLYNVYCVDCGARAGNAVKCYDHAVDAWNRRSKKQIDVFDWNDAVVVNPGRGRYIVTRKRENGELYVCIARRDKTSNSWLTEGGKKAINDVVSWMELPKPYEFTDEDYIEV